MNDDPTLSSTANELPTHPDDNGARHEGGLDQGRGGDGAAQPAPSSSAPSSTELSLKRKAGLAKKLQFMTNLMRNLDMIVFAEMCTLYYMECSFPRLLLRAIPHYFFLSPKSENILLLLPAQRPHVFAIFVPNILCILLHMVWSLPHAGEASRGYLHGGVIVDFIGQKPPASKLTLLLLDLVILAVQCLMLAVHQDRENLRKIVLPITNATTANPGSSSSPPPPATAQDHDAEERGVLRDDETSDIELRSLPDSHAQEGNESREEATGLLEGASSRGPTAPDLMGVLRSGNARLGNFHVVHAIRAASVEQQSTTSTTAASSIQSLGYNATLAALAAQRRARLQTQRRQ